MFFEKMNLAKKYKNDAKFRENTFCVCEISQKIISQKKLAKTISFVSATINCEKIFLSFTSAKNSHFLFCESFAFFRETDSSEKQKFSYFSRAKT